MSRFDFHTGCWNHDRRNFAVKIRCEDSKDKQGQGSTWQTDDFKKEIYEACRTMVELEDRFLDLVFEQGDIEGLTKKEMQKYIRYIADRRLLQLGLKPNYNVKDNPLGWLDEVLGVEHQNFFEGRATAYMKAGLRGDMQKVKFANVA